MMASLLDSYDVETELKTGKSGIHILCVDSEASPLLFLPLDWTPARSGGQRKSFQCPISNRGGICGRLCRKLFLPSQNHVPGCRDCYRLTYSSSQNRLRRLKRSLHEYDKLSERAEQLLNEQAFGRVTPYHDLLKVWNQIRLASDDLYEVLGKDIDLDMNHNYVSEIQL